MPSLKRRRPGRREQARRKQDARQRAAEPQGEERQETRQAPAAKESGAYAYAGVKAGKPEAACAQAREQGQEERQRTRPQQAQGRLQRKLEAASRSGRMAQGADRAEAEVGKRAAWHEHASEAQQRPGQGPTRADGVEPPQRVAGEKARRATGREVKRWGEKTPPAR